MEIKGTVIQNLGLQKGTSKAGKEWSKAEIVIEYGDQYKKKVKLSNMKNAESFALLPVGTTGSFEIDIESREFKERWYTEVNCWKWEIPQGYSQEDTLPQMTTDPLYTNSKASYSDLEMPEGEKPSQEERNEDSKEDDQLPF